MTRHILPLLLAMAFIPMTASAHPGSAAALLQGSFESLRAAGYAGLENSEVPAAPKVTPVAYAAGDQTADALQALIGAAQAKPETSGFIAETAVALGLELRGDKFWDHHLTTEYSQDVIRTFSTADLHGETVILVEIFFKATKTLHSYRASASGALQAAAATTKSGGRFHATPIALPDAAASTEYDDQIRFWTQYSRDHLKP